MHYTHTTTAKLLLAESDLSAVAEISALLACQGFTIKTADSQLSALQALEKESFDIALLNTSLSDGSGYSLCSLIKEKFNIPVIFISCLDDENSIVTGLDMGADDYITTPFRERELLSRIRSAMRRGGKVQSVLEYRDIRVDTVKGIVSKNGKELYLSALEYRLLLIFLSNKGRVLSRDLLLGQVWDSDGSFVSDNTLTVYIKRIREKIEDNPASPQIIKTIRGKGYRVGE